MPPSSPEAEAERSYGGYGWSCSCMTGKVVAAYLMRAVLHK